MQHITNLLTQHQLNTICNNNTLYAELARLTQEDPVFIACQGYPGGTVIANKKGSVRLDGIHIRLGERFLTATKVSAPAAVSSVTVQQKEPAVAKKKKPLVRKAKKGKRK